MSGLRRLVTPAASAVVGASLAVLTLTAARPVAAQDVMYRTRTSVSFGGAMDRIVGLAARLGGGSADMDTEEVQYIKGPRMRTDSDGTSSIADLERGRFITLDHSARTYVEFSVDSMAAMMQAMAGNVEQAREERAEAAAAEPDEPPQVEFTFDVAVDRTGERESILGYDAERSFVTVTVDARDAGAAPGEPGGRFVVLMDIWSSRSVPGHDVLEGLSREQGEWVARAGAAELGEAFAAAMASEPGQRAAFERAAEEMGKVEGMHVRTTTYMVVGTTDHPFDRQVAIAPPERREGGGVSVGDAARSALGGLLGRGRPAAPPPEPEPEPTQLTLFKSVQELVEVSTSPLSDALFEVPEGYRRVGG